jgi:hypothetical protein
MTVSRKSLGIGYALIGLIALIGTWGNNIQYLHLGLVGANVEFWRETLVNPASRSITVDILFLGLAAIVWMFLEARRLSMRGIWLYVLASVFVAISIAFPVFLIHRERMLARQDGSTTAGTLSATDLLGLALLAVSILGYTIITLAM